MISQSQYGIFDIELDELESYLWTVIIGYPIFIIIYDKVGG